MAVNLRRPHHRRPLAEAARDAGWRVTLATAPHAAVAGLAADGFSHIALPVDRFRFNPLADARLFGSLLTWLNDHTSDVFVVCTSNDISKLPPEFVRAERSAPFHG
jgi:predicted ATPase